jgi:hypothetical protein
MLLTPNRRKNFCPIVRANHWVCVRKWQAMTFEEAYPASSGKVCVKCDTYKLGWFCEINSPGGEKLADEIVSALTRKK